MIPLFRELSSASDPSAPSLKRNRKPGVRPVKDLRRDFIGGEVDRPLQSIIP